MTCSCSEKFRGIDGLAGVIVPETRTGAVTVRSEGYVPLSTVPSEHLIPATPTATPVARPAGLIVATPMAVEVHCTELVTSCVVPSVSIPVATNCWVRPLGIAVISGVILIDCRTGGPTAATVDPLSAADVALIVVFPW